MANVALTRYVSKHTGSVIDAAIDKILALGTTSSQSITDATTYVETLANIISPNQLGYNVQILNDGKTKQNTHQILIPRGIGTSAETSGVKWEETNNFLATGENAGFIKIGYSEANSGTSPSRNYAVKISSEGKAYVNVPWIKYSSLSPTQSGTMESLVTTGEKYTWNNKQAELEAGDNILLLTQPSGKVRISSTSGAIYLDCSDTIYLCGRAMGNSRYNFIDTIDLSQCVSLIDMLKGTSRLPIVTAYKEGELSGIDDPTLRKFTLNFVGEYQVDALNTYHWIYELKSFDFPPSAKANSSSYLASSTKKLFNVKLHITADITPMYQKTNFTATYSVIPDIIDLGLKSPPSSVTLDRSYKLDAMILDNLISETFSPITFKIANAGGSGEYLPLLAHQGAWRNYDSSTSQYIAHQDWFISIMNNKIYTLDVTYGPTLNSYTLTESTL